MEGLVYVLTNPDMPGLVKVGMTTRTVEDRIRELDSTGVPSSFVHQYSARFEDAYDAEQKAHTALNQFRHRKEYFRIDVPDAILAIESLGLTYRKEYCKRENDARLAELRRIAEEKRRREEALKRQEAERKQRELEEKQRQDEEKARVQRLAEEEARQERERLLQNPTYKSNHSEGNGSIWIGGAVSFLVFLFLDDNDGFIGRLIISLIIGLFAGGATEILRLALVNCWLYLDGRYDHRYSETWHPKYILAWVAAVGILI